MNARVFLPRQLDGSAGEITFELAHSRSHATVYWHLDDEFITQTEDFHKVSLIPSPGKHSMTVVDDQGNSISVTFHVQGK